MGVSKAAVPASNNGIKTDNAENTFQVDNPLQVHKRVSGKC